MHTQNKFTEISSRTGPVKAKVLAIHGLGLYGAVFEDFRKFLENFQIELRFFDLLGFGSLQRKELTSYQSWIRQVQQEWQKLMQESAASQPTYLLGHSLGGIIAVNAIRTLQPRPTGLILSVPAFWGNPEKFPFWQFMLPTFGKYLGSLIAKKKELVNFGFSKDTKDFLEQLKDKKEQQLATGQTKPAVFFEILKLNLLAWQSLLKLQKTDLLMLISRKDQVCLSGASSLFFNLSNSLNKTKRTFELSHDLFALKERTEVYQAICDWILSSSSLLASY